MLEHLSWVPMFFEYGPPCLDSCCTPVYPHQLLSADFLQPCFAASCRGEVIAAWHEYGSTFVLASRRAQRIDDVRVNYNHIRFSFVCDLT